MNEQNLTPLHPKYTVEQLRKIAAAVMDEPPSKPVERTHTPETESIRFSLIGKLSEGAMTVGEIQDVLFRHGEEMEIQRDEARASNAELLEALIKTRAWCMAVLNGVKASEFPGDLALDPEREIDAAIAKYTGDAK